MTNSSKVEQPLIFSVLSIISIFIAVVAILIPLHKLFFYNRCTLTTSRNNHY